LWYYYEQGILKRRIMKVFKGLAALMLIALIPVSAFAFININNSFLSIDVDECMFNFTLGTSASYAVPNANLLFEYTTPFTQTIHTVVKIDGNNYEFRDCNSGGPCPVTTPLAIGTNFITGTKKVNNVDINCRWELVNNPAVGSPQDTMMLKYVFKNNDIITHTVALRLELDTEVLNVDGANISVDNGFSVILQNSVWRKTDNNIPTNWWDYDISPLVGTPNLVGRGYNKNNAFGEAATEPDIFQIGYWRNVNGPFDGTGTSILPQWTLWNGELNGSTGDSINNDSAVVLWWCNGNETSPGFTLNPGQSKTFITYYGLNKEPLLTTPTSTQTWSATFTNTPTFTQTLTHTVTETYTNTPTITMTYTYSFTPTATPTSTMTVTATITQTFTMTDTFTVTVTITPTATASPTYTATPTITETSTYTNTATITPTPTITMTFTPTPPPLELISKGNFPNPFMIDTQIVYWLSVDADVKIKIFDVSGEIVRTQEGLDGKKGYNSFYWDGKNRAQKPVASGVFIYRIDASTVRDKPVWVYSKAACAR
jgi:hypothetical protein